MKVHSINKLNVNYILVTIQIHTVKRQTKDKQRRQKSRSQREWWNTYTIIGQTNLKLKLNR